MNSEGISEHLYEPSSILLSVWSPNCTLNNFDPVIYARYSIMDVLPEPTQPVKQTTRPATKFI